MRRIHLVVLALTAVLLWGITAAAQQSEYEYLLVETENNTYINTSKYKLVDSGGYTGTASGGAYVRATASYFGSADNTTPAELVCSVNIPRKDAYFIWHRIRVESGRMAWFSVDNGRLMSIKYNGGDTDWAWSMVGCYTLSEGEHSLNLIHYSRTLSTDCYLITNNPHYVPEGVVNPSSNEFDPNNGAEPYPIQSNPYNEYPQYTPPKEHPRIEFTKADLPKIRGNLSHPENEAVYKELLKLADTNIGDASADFAAYPSEGNFSAKNGAVIEANAFLYQLAGDEERGRNAVKWVRNYVGTTMIDTENRDKLSRDGAYLAYMAAKVYDWCYDLLTDEDKKYLETFMLYRLSLTEVGWPSVKYNYNVNGHALESQLLKDTLACGIALYDERQDVYKLAAGRIIDKIVPARRIADGSIFPSEGASYGAYRFQFQLEAALLFKAMGYDDIFDAENQQYALYGMFYQQRPDGVMFNTGDNSGESVRGCRGASSEAFFLAANLYGDSYLKAQYHKMVKNGTPTASTVGYNAITPTRFLILNDVGVGISSARDLPLSVFSGYPMGYMAARTSWDEGADSGTAAVLMNIQQLYLNGHQHKDSGNFDIYYKGILSVDSGIYENGTLADGSPTGYGSEHHINYARQSIAHNTMLIIDPNEAKSNDSIIRIDGGQRGKIGVSYCASADDFTSDEVVMGSVLSRGWGPDYYRPAYTYMKGDMTAAYTDKVENFQRTFIFFNFFDKDYPAALIVFDDLTASNADFTKKWLIHSQEEPEINETEKSITIRRTEFGYGGRLINQTLLPKEAVYNKVGGEEHEFDIGGYNFSVTPNTVTQDSGRWRTEISPKNKEKQDYFLNVMQVGENNSEIEPLSAEIIENTDEYVGVHIKDRIAYIKKDGRTRADKLTIHDGSGGECMYVVTGLAEGEWYVYNNDGTLMESCRVTEEDDSLSFAAVRGVYRLVYQKSDAAERDMTLSANLGFAQKTDIDVKVGIFYETFSKPFFEREGMAYAPIDAVLEKLEIPYEKTNVGFRLSDTGVVISESAEDTILNDDTLYMEAGTLLKYIGGSAVYDSVGKVVWIDYTGRTADDIFNLVPIVQTESDSHYWEENAFDNDTGTYWSSNNEQPWLKAELSSGEYLSKVRIYWKEAGLKYDISVSEDGENRYVVHSGVSPGSNVWETVTLSTAIKCRYIRIDFYRSGNKQKISVGELRVYKDTENSDKSKSIEFDLSQSSKVYFVLNRPNLTERLWKQLKPNWFKEGYKLTDNAFYAMLADDGGRTLPLADNATICKEYYVDPGETIHVRFDELEVLGNYPMYVFVK